MNISKNLLIEKFLKQKITPNQRCGTKNRSIALSIPRPNSNLSGYIIFLFKQIIYRTHNVEENYVQPSGNADQRFKLSSTPIDFSNTIKIQRKSK